MSDTWNWNIYGVPWAVGKTTNGPGPQSEFSTPRGVLDIGIQIAAVFDNNLKLRGKTSNPGICANHDTLDANVSTIGETPNDADIFLNSSTYFVNSSRVAPNITNNG